MTAPQDLTARATAILSDSWREISLLAQAGKLPDTVSERGLRKSIERSINSKIKTYRYVLPTQVVSKLADPSLDCTCVQASRSGAGAFDARTIAHGVIVPFDQRNDNVLGGSQEPYVNNPLRVPEISRKHRKAQKDRAGWDHLCSVLNDVQRKNNPKWTLAIFKQVLVEVYKRLSTVRVVYPTPKRVSLKKALHLIQEFLVEHSGGDRLLALSSALFAVIGRNFGLYSEVRRGKITAADKATGMLADLECVSTKGEVIFVVEVKDRQVTVSQVRAKMRTVREKKVAEIFFVAQGTVPKEQKEIDRLIDNEFTSGHNVYVPDLISLSRVALALLGESGRSEFLRETANQLEKYRSEINHRRAWASLLDKTY